MTLPTNILVATDFGELADRALDYAIELAVKFGATIHLVHNISVPAIGIPDMGTVPASAAVDGLVREGESMLQRVVARARDKATFGNVILRIGDPRDAIVEVAKEVHADLIVIGTHGRHGVARALLGSVAEAVVRAAPCPVMTVR